LSNKLYINKITKELARASKCFGIIAELIK